MNSFRKVTLTVLGALVVAVTVYGGFSRFASPQSVARADSYHLWIALLKGYEGDVYYVGNDSQNAYFRTGRVLWAYFKVPACAARPPETFPVGSGKAYVVRLHIQPDNTIHTVKSCTSEQGYELGQLDRA